MARERDIQQRALGCFGLSVILHAAAMAAILISPQLNVLLEPAGANESLTEGSGGGASLELVSARPAGPESQPETQPEAKPEVAAEQPVAAPAPVAEKPVPAPVEAPQPMPVAKPVATAKAEPTKVVSAPKQQAAPARTTTRPKSTATPQEVSTNENGDIAAAIAASRAADTDSDLEKPEAPASAAPAKRKPVVAETDLAPVEAKATSTVGESDEDEEAAPIAIAALSKRQAPALTTEPIQTESEYARTDAPAAAPKAAASGGNAGGGGTGEQPNARERNAGVSGAAGGAASANAIRNADDLREAPGNKKPAYPDEDRLAQREGTVVFVAFVERDGTISQIRNEKSASSPSLDKEALTAFQKYRYMPGQQGWIRKAFTFSLRGDAEEIPTRLRR